MALRPEVVVEAGNELGEGVLWSPAHQEVQWTDIFGRRFWAYRPSDGMSRSVALPDRMTCFAPLGGTRLLAGFTGGLEVFDLQNGARQPIAAVEADRPSTRLNDGRLDRWGRLMFGTMDEDQPARPIGQVYSYEAGAAPRRSRERCSPSAPASAASPTRPFPRRVFRSSIDQRYAACGAGPGVCYRRARISAPCGGLRGTLAGRGAVCSSGGFSCCSRLTAANSARSCEQISLTSPAAWRASSRKRA